MAQTINTNMLSMTAQRNLSRSQMSQSIAMNRLSSGLRVNSAKDDAAGLAIAERMNTQVRGMNVAIRNANDGISLAQTAEGGLAEISNMLQRMRELAVQSANGTNSTSDRANLNAEFQQLNTEIARIGDVTQFNGKTILRGADATTYSFQVGANAGETMSIATQSVSNLNASVGGADATAADLALASIDAKIDEITTQRATYGAAQSRFESAINNLQIGSENQAAARSRIMDADYAKETAAMTRAQVLQQAGIAMVSQANQAPQQVLSLLQG